MRRTCVVGQFFISEFSFFSSFFNGNLFFFLLLHTIYNTNITYATLTLLAILPAATYNIYRYLNGPCNADSLQHCQLQYASYTFHIQFFLLRANESNHQTNRGKPQKIDFAQTL